MCRVAGKFSCFAEPFAKLDSVDLMRHLMHWVLAGCLFWTGGAAAQPLWTLRNPLQVVPSTNTLHAGAWSGSLMVVVGDDGLIATSPDGAQWTTRASGTHDPLYQVVWTGTQFAISGYHGIFLTSKDGVDWTPQKTGSDDNLFSLVWTGKPGIGFVAGGTGEA